MTHFIIFEGVDGTGKTTQLTKMFESLPLGTVIEKLPNTDEVCTLTFWKNFIEKQKELNIPFVLLDRSFITEYVYGITKRLYSRFSLDDIVEILNYMENVTIMLFDTKNSFNLSKTRGEDYIVKLDEHLKIKDFYYKTINDLLKHDNLSNNINFQKFNFVKDIKDKNV